MSRSQDSRLESKLEEFRRRVRKLPRGGDLGSLLDEGVSELRALFYEEMLAEREESASSEADFPPSGVPPLRRDAPVPPGDEASPSPDAER